MSLQRPPYTFIIFPYIIIMVLASPTLRKERKNIYEKETDRRADDCGTDAIFGGLPE